MANFNCIVCYKEVKDKPSHIKKRKFCSRKCRSSLAQKNNCSICNVEFRIYKNGHKNKTYCSYKCSARGKSLKVTINKNCLFCRKIFMQTRWRKNKFCSANCFFLYNKGVNHYAFKGVYNTNSKIRGSSEYKEWRNFIYKRDNFTCQICGDTNKLRANHIKRFADYFHLRFETTNGITICSNCDYKLILKREEEWESYFNFNLEARRII